MQRWTRAFGASLLLVGISAGSAFAWPDRLDGRPEQFEVGGDSAYYIWTDGENDFHLATTGPGPRRHFVAVIQTDGEITDVDQVRLEGDDSFELEDGGQKLVVHFETFGHADNIQWKIRGGNHATFNLRVDGHPIRPVNVYLGHEGYHPIGPIFRVHR
ncbi:MAG TPA: hypothetical protein VFH48_08295 [Chloroflexota bacterium]|nr:hypothetical protein [Chloroflexota bacterium]